MLIFLFFAAALAVAPDCDLERPSGATDCTREGVDALPMTRMQVVGTHNSYKQAISPPEMARLAMAAKGVARTLDYAHPSLESQLDAGARQLELDLLHDPEGGRYADPLGAKLARLSGAGLPSWDAGPMHAPGLKVLHVQDIDYRSNCARFTDCLKIIGDWSAAHPDHLPLLILINLKEDVLSFPGTVKPLLFDAAAVNAIDGEIRAVFREDRLITPDQVQGAYATLRDAVAAGAWPLLGAARGRVLFALDAPPDQVARYREGRASLEGRVMFVNIEETSPAAAYITLNDPLAQDARIRAAVGAGLIVRTRADADTVQARTGDTAMRDAALASAAQYVSTDYMTPDLRWSAYQVGLPGGMTGRIGPDPR
jgi:hypothetical protein